MLGSVWLCVTLWTVTCQAPLSMRFPRQEYWCGLPFPSPGDLPDPGIEPTSPALQADFLSLAPPGKPNKSLPCPSCTPSTVKGSSQCLGRRPKGPPLVPMSGELPHSSWNWIKASGRIHGREFQTLHFSLQMLFPRPGPISWSAVYLH